MDNAHALVVGIANYQKIKKLPETVLKDARDIYEMLVSSQYCAYSTENVQLILDGEATQSTLIQALSKLSNHSNKDSTVFIYISSHGGQIEFGTYMGEYLLAVDTDPTSEASLAETAISGAIFTEALRAIPAQRLVIVFDCCHSGGIGQPKDANMPMIKSGLPESYYDALKQGRGRVILASSRSTEFSYVLSKDENSLFTKHLLAGLRGGISSNDGLIRIFDLFEYVQPRVTGEEPSQHPIFKAELEENIPVALYLGGQKNFISQVQEGFRYDAYISYADREPDITWVWDTLVPRLEEAKLRIAVSGDSEDPGIARVVNVERGIKQSKRTVIVLSQAYLDDTMAGFENILGQTIGIQEGTYRLLPVQSEPIDLGKLPTRLSMLSTLNLSHPRRAEQGFERLVRALRDPLPRM